MKHPLFSSALKPLATAVVTATVAAALLLTHVATRAAIKCANAAGSIAYADVACPLGYKPAGDVAPMPAVNAADQASAKAQTARDQKAADSLEKQRLANDRASAKARSAAHSKSTARTKSCKSAELAVKRAQDRYDDAPSASSKANASGKKSKAQNHIVVREGDDKASKAKKKASHALEHAKAKRDLVCG